jgi:hypothetical protein
LVTAPIALALALAGTVPGQAASTSAGPPHSAAARAVEHTARTAQPGPPPGTPPAQRSTITGTVGPIGENVAVCRDSAKAYDSAGRLYWYDTAVVPAPVMYAVYVPGQLVGNSHIQTVSFRADLWRYYNGVWTRVAKSHTYFTAVGDQYNGYPSSNVNDPYWLDQNAGNVWVNLKAHPLVFTTATRNAWYTVQFLYTWYADDLVPQGGTAYGPAYGHNWYSYTRLHPARIDPPGSWYQGHCDGRWAYI